MGTGQGGTRGRAATWVRGGVQMCVGSCVHCVCAPCVCTAVQTHMQSHVHGCANTCVVMQLCSRSGMQARLHARGHRHMVVQTRVRTRTVMQAHAPNECVLRVDMSTLVQMLVFTCTKSGQHAYTWACTFTRAHGRANAHPKRARTNAHTQPCPHMHTRCPRHVSHTHPAGRAGRWPRARTT